jgi:ABC-type nitrate/sulfonate/bicarbonate transport system substrate-binding protein
VHEILKHETHSGEDGVATAYRNGFHKSLHPDLSDELIDLFRIQKNFTWLHGVLDKDFNLDGWIDRRPLEVARQLLNSQYENQRKTA